MSNNCGWTLQENSPALMFAFLPSDMVSQILNFGLPAPIDVQVSGMILKGIESGADQLLQEDPVCARHNRPQSSAAFRQSVPALDYRTDEGAGTWLLRSRRRQNLLVSLSGSFQTSPTFWLDPRKRRELFRSHPTPQ